MVTARSETFDLLDNYARRKRFKKAYLWGCLYHRLQSRTGKDLYADARRARVSVAKVIDIYDIWEAALSIAREIFR